jgi:hypothetical protein
MLSTQKRTCVRSVTLLVAMSGLLLQLSNLAAEPPGPAYKLATFSVDATIPLGHRCMGVLPTKSKRIADPLYVHGFVLAGARISPIVLCGGGLVRDPQPLRTTNGGRRWPRRPAPIAATRAGLFAAPARRAGHRCRGSRSCWQRVGLAGELYDERISRRCGSPGRARLCEDSLAEARQDDPSRRWAKRASSRRVESARGVLRRPRGRSNGAAAAARIRCSPRTPGRRLIDPLLKTISFWDGDQPAIGAARVRHASDELLRTR